MNVLILLFILFLPLTTHSKVIQGDHVQVRLISQDKNLKGQFTLGVHFKLEPHWHVYWKNPGDSGAAPKFQPVGAEVRNISWPYPTRLPVDSLTNYGYEGETVIFLDLESKTEKMSLKLEWLVCKVECIPGFGEIEIAPRTIKVQQELFTRFQQRIPKEKRDGETKFLKQDERQFEFDLILSGGDRIKNLFVFPENGQAFLTKLPSMTPTENRIRIALPLSPNASILKDEAFTFVTENQGGEIESFTKIVNVSSQSIWLALFLAFIGGMILNLMPCVFPVLFLKAFGFLKEPNPKAVRKSSWEYTWGVLTTFSVIGGGLALLRASGQAVGWGYQLQNPSFTYLLALLFFLMGLNFYGFFEMGNWLTSQSSKLNRLKIFAGSFGTGVLAVIVASPCTAPFMGTALGASLVLPPYQSVFIFLALGFGMALPMLLLAYIPQLVKRLPRSGPWMTVVKQFMSFPLFATSIWLLWILGNQKGEDGIFASLVSFLIVVIAIWALSFRSTKYLALVLIIAAPIATMRQIKTLDASLASSQSSWVPFDANLVETRRKDQPVFIDFTAAWCITCQVNKKVVLQTEEILEVFRLNNVFLMQADWTSHDSKITEALAKFNRNSVPLYVFYNRMSEPVVLPEILTKDLIKNLFNNGEKK